MPTYEYQCGTCGNRFEKFQKFSDEPIKICPECGQLVKKVISPAGIIFKGSGWYINDSKKTTTSTVPAKDTEAKDSETKTDSAVPVAAKESSPGSTSEAKGEPAPSKAEPATKKSEAAA